MSRSYRIFECKGCKKIFIKSIDHTRHIAQCDEYKAKFPSSTTTNTGVSSTTHSQRSSAATVKPQSGTKREVITLSDSDEETTVADKQKTRSAHSGQCVTLTGMPISDVRIILAEKSVNSRQFLKHGVLMTFMQKA